MMGVNHQNHNFLVLDLIALNIIYIYLMVHFYVLCITKTRMMSGRYLQITDNIKKKELTMRRQIPRRDTWRFSDQIKCWSQDELNRQREIKELC